MIRQYDKMTARTNINDFTSFSYVKPNDASGYPYPDSHFITHIDAESNKSHESVWIFGRSTPANEKSKKKAIIHRIVLYVDVD